MAAKTMPSPFSKEKKPRPIASNAMLNPFAKERKPVSPKILDSIRAKRSADGGFEMQHQFSGYDHEPEMYQAKDGHHALKHIAKHMGISDVNIAPKAAPAPGPVAVAPPAANPQDEEAEEAGEGEE